jgi:hypothetical protein
VPPSGSALLQATLWSVCIAVRRDAPASMQTAGFIPFSRHLPSCLTQNQLHLHLVNMPVFSRIQPAIFLLRNRHEAHPYTPIIPSEAWCFTNGSTAYKSAPRGNACLFFADAGREVAVALGRTEGACRNVNEAGSVCRPKCGSTAGMQIPARAGESGKEGRPRRGNARMNYLLLFLLSSSR